MFGIDLGIAQHQLNIHPKHKAIHQKPQRFTPNRQAMIEEKANKLLCVDFIYEVHYPKCLTNIVIVKNKLNLMYPIQKITFYFLKLTSWSIQLLIMSY
ncbi:hypothetical protein BHM03_00055056 [Ensete ventricosum]|nr:hypothetical protein BHM03_00055056 [Ensete ventricosum]